MHLRYHRWVIAALCLCLSPYAVASDTSHPACQPSVEIEAALGQFSFKTADWARNEGNWDEYERELDAVVERHPSNVHLQRRYQDLHRPGLEDLIERYRQQAADTPGDPAALYLYGRILGILERKEAEAPLLEALRVDPLYPWAHLGLARFYEVSFPDPNKAQSHIAAFIEQCPTSPIVIGRLREISNPEVARKVAASLRSVFVAAEDPGLIPQLQAVWTAEFKALPPDEHSAVRERIGRDLVLLRKQKTQQDERALEALLQGYVLVGDEEGVTWAIETMARSFPHNRSARRVAMQRFNERHHAPEDGDTSPESQEYYREFSVATLRWSELWPDDPEVWLARFDALAGTTDVQPEELLAAIDTLLEIIARRPDFQTEPLVPFQIASVLVRKEMALDRVPVLVEQGLQQLEARKPQIMGEGPEVALYISQIEQMVGIQGWMGREALFDAYMKQGRLDEARATIAEMERLLPHESPPGPGESDDHESRHLRASWSSRRAALAQAEGQIVDALLYYHAALTLDPLAPDSPRDAAGELWQELGAGEEALRSWSMAGAALELPFGEPKVLELPDFELQDLDGRTWSLSDLRGKAVLINVWAAWCGPCLVELPWLQKLHDRTRDRPDLVVLTLNVDENPGVVEPIMRRNGYDFPVVFAFQYMFDLWGPRWAIPCTWIVDPQGTVRREQSGFGASDERWLADVMHAMEQVAQGDQGAP